MPTQSEINYFYETLCGYRVTQCLYVAAKLRIADFLSDKAIPIAELASLAKVNTDALCRILRCLVAHGIFSEEKENKFKLNSISKLLKSDYESNALDFVTLCGEEFYQAMGDLLYSVKNGKPAFDIQHDQDFWHYIQKNKSIGVMFNEAMKKGSLNTINSILNIFHHRVCNIYFRHRCRSASKLFY